jgi:hypothetical protein
VEKNPSYCKEETIFTMENRKKFQIRNERCDEQEKGEPPRYQADYGSRQ